LQAYARANSDFAATTSRGPRQRCGRRGSRHHYDLPNKQYYSTASRPHRARQKTASPYFVTDTNRAVDAISIHRREPRTLKFNDLGILCNEEGEPIFENM
jgi:hypothetical protein